MGVTMKGAHTHGNNIMHMHAAQNSRRWNVLTVIVVVLVFGASVFGLMGLHRLKDKRLFNLLIKEKDHQIISLQYLLQKERDRVQEYKLKINEMRMKTQSLRSHKEELMGRISEMESTISSLKDEQRTVELAFQEKENEAKLLRERYIQVMNQNTHRVEALTEIIRQREAEIEDLKRHLKSPAESTDGLPANIEAKEYVSGSETTINNKRGEESGEMMHQSIREDFSSEKRTKNEDETERIMIDAGDEDHENKQFRDGEILNNESTSISSLEGRENKEVGVHKGGVKMETQDNSQKLSGRHSNGNGWRGANNSGKLFQHVKIGNRLEEGKPVKDLQFGIDEQGSFKDNLRGYSKEDGSPGIKSQHNRPINTEDLSRNNTVADSKSLSTHFSANDVPNNAKIDGETTESSVQHVEEDQSKDDQGKENKRPIPGETEVENNEYPAENESQTEVGVST